MMMKRTVLAAAAIATLVGSMQGTQAATTTTTLGVSASAAAACTLSASAIAFGTLNPSAATTATGSVTVNCTNGDSLTIALDAGLNASGTQRQLINGTNKLNYNLYQPTATGNAQAAGPVA